MQINRTTRALGAITLILSLGFALSACGNDDGDGDTPQVSSTEHNDADVAFATDMMQHHAQALVMVDMTMSRDLDSEVHQLTDDIRAAQGPEIETFTDWDEEVPETMRDHGNAGHDMGDMDDMGDAMEGMDTDMPGMMSADDMNSLNDAPDADFQTMWLEMMIEHHEGAVEMAQDQTEDGQYKPAIELAGDITSSQNAEIETMESLLGS